LWLVLPQIKENIEISAIGKNFNMGDSGEIPKRVAGFMAGNWYVSS